MYTHNIYSTLFDQDLRTTFTSTIQLYSFVSHKSIFCLGVQNLDILEEWCLTLFGYIGNLKLNEQRKKVIDHSTDLINIRW